MTDARRINRGRGHSYEVDGRSVPGVTTILDKGYPKPALINWAANVTTDCAIDRWDELVDLRPSQRAEILRRARFDHRDEAAQRGTAAHGLIQQLARGEEVEPSDALLGYVDAYLRFVDDWQPREVFTEAPVFSLQYGYAGTPDVIATLADDRTWLLDFKTGGKGVFPEFVLQLAAYRYADVYLADDGELRPIPTVERTGCIWIQDGHYDLIPVEAGPAAFAVFGACHDVYRFATAERDEWIGEALRPPTREAA